MLRTGAVSTGTPTAPSAERVGRAALTLWSPNRRSRADQLEATLTFIQRRSEMKALWCGAAAVIDEAGPTASHGGSFVHQGQSHPGEHSPQTSINRERRDRHV